MGSNEQRPRRFGARRAGSVNCGAGSGCLALLSLALGLVVGHAGQVPFSAPRVVPVNPVRGLVGDITVADYSRQGCLDIIGSSFVSRQISLELWRNIPPWQTNVALSLPIVLRNLYSLAAGDLDRNGDLEIVLSGVSSTGNVLSCYGWDSIPIAQAAVDQIELADVDGDGDLDVVGGDSSGQVSWWEHTGGTNWPVHVLDTLQASVIHCVTADLDGDGDADVAAGLPYNNLSLIWWENRDARGTDWRSHPLSTNENGAHRPRAADLDQDGDLDLTASTFTAPGVGWWENRRGDATAWIEHPLSSGFENTGPVQAADLDQDGDLDLVASEYYGPGMVWWENQRDQPVRWVPHALPADPDQHTGAPQTGDFDRDGDTDIVYRTATSVHWLENRTLHRSALFPAPQSIVDFFTGASRAPSADINGDGLTDILGISSLGGGGGIRTWLNTGIPDSRWFTWNVDLNPDGAASARLADLDRDGDLDILGAVFSAHAIRWWENDGAYLPSWTVHSIATDFAGARDVTAADVDGDGDPDALGVAFLEDRLSWWENDGTPRDDGWVLHDVSLSMTGACAIVAADMDRDGDTDIVGASELGITWWENNAGPAGPAFTPYPVDTQTPGIASLDLADLDRDGDLDIVGAVSDEEDVCWWENRSGFPPIWPRRAISNYDFQGARDARAADLDHDGDLDILGAGENLLCRWDNLDGAGAQWLAHTNGLDFPNLTAVAAADLDHDGDLDLVTTGGITSNQIAWWPNEGGQFGAMAAKTGPAALWNGQTAALLEVEVAHRGWPGDPPLELATLRLFLEGNPGHPLTQAEANAILDSLSVYHDDSDGQLDGGDILVQVFPTLSVTQGLATLALPHGSPNPGISPAATERFFVVVTTTPNAHAQSPARFSLSLPSQSGVGARDLEAQAPLLPEFSPTVATDSYLIRDLVPLEIDSFTRQPDGSVRLGWGSLGPGWAYTVESGWGLTNGSWYPAPSPYWPIQENTWTDTTATNASTRFYRIQAVPPGP